MKNLEILFFYLGEAGYCARKNEIIDITGGNIIYHLPLMPTFFDGVVDLNGTTTYVFDLASLIGINSGSPAHEGTLFIISKKDPPAAFRVDEIGGEASIRNEEIIQIPDYLKSEFINSCAIHDERLVPIINLSVILKSIFSRQVETIAKLSLSPPAPTQKEKISKENIRFFLLGDETYASSGFEPAQPILKLSSITVIPGTPDFITGISHFQGAALTIIDTSLRIKGKKSAGSKVLISKIGKDLFGFVVDAEKKHKGLKFQALDLPNLIRKKWMTSALFTGKEVIPMLSLSRLLSPEEPADKEMLAKSYSPDPIFEQSFFKKTVNITEFVLMGKHHALPAMQVREVLTLKRYRSLPGMPSIIVGVCEYKGNLLPVIDIEACFGIKSDVTKSWKMIHLENGDFSCLILTKAVLDEKELPPELHRKIPLITKHRFLYGCYPDNDAKMISLTLNVYKMAVYFDEEILKKIFKSTNPAGNDEKAVAVEVTPTQDEQKSCPEATKDEHGVPIDKEGGENVQADNLFKPQDGLGVETKPLIEAEEPVPTEERQDSRLEPARVFEEEVKDSIFTDIPGELQNDHSLRERPSEYTQHKASPEASTAVPSKTVGKSKGYIWVFFSTFVLLCMALFYFFSPHSRFIKDQTNSKPSITVIKRPAIIEKATPAENRGADHGIPKTGIAKQSATASEDYPVKKETTEITNKAVPEKVKESITFVPVEIIKPANKDAIQTIKPKKWKRNKNKYYPPLGEFDFYTVEEGDTLWDIAAAYSKNPYDYNLVAEDNKIIDPDLIYPGQRLRLQKKLKVDKRVLPEQNKPIP